MGKLFRKYRSTLGVFTIIGLIGVGFWYYYTYVAINESTLDKIEEKLNKDKELSKYFSSFEFSKDENAESVEYNGLTSYPYNLLSSVNANFSELDNSQKASLISKAAMMVTENNDGINFACGYKKYCSLDGISLFEWKKDGYYTTDYDRSYQPEDYVITYNDGHGKEEKLNASAIEKSGSDKVETTSAKTTPILQVTDVDYKLDGDYNIVTGAVRNNGDKKYSFIQLKVSYLDESNNVIDTDTTYAAGDEGILPGEEKAFEVMTKLRSSVKYKRCKVDVMDFN
ncbi:FxLYD domain-containing protein [Bacillus sp. SJS]|uniref:FxLYD domain-containing protein n=1 Tax=Bacillus sp. SJS TaxID=1423321 RepID=UPI0004DCBCA6|nr:FxLYD domain-containing protein [Bacillus sp. SJS]KZZ85637.1 hypothetical protein AS29_003350 [Bacillus sp. SJS]